MIQWSTGKASEPLTWSHADTSADRQLHRGNARIPRVLRIGTSRSPGKMPWTRELDRVQDLVPFDLVLVVGDGSSVSQARELPQPPFTTLRSQLTPKCSNRFASSLGHDKARYAVQSRRHDHANGSVEGTEDEARKPDLNE